MFTPSRCNRSWFLMIALAMLAGCAEEGGLVGPEESSSFALGRGGGGGSGGGPVVEEFDSWDMTAWIARDHPLGRGEFKPENVSHDDGKLVLTLPAHSYDGGEIQSASRVRFRDIEIRLKTPRARGSISAFFLFQLDPGTNDEIDIEILNGSRQILFTTWVAGVETNHVKHKLDFDPAKDFHDYRIEWSRRRVRFLVDGVPMQQWTTGVPQQAMYVFSNAWWPTWLSGPQLGTPRAHEIDRITY